MKVGASEAEALLIPVQARRVREVAQAPGREVPPRARRDPQGLYRGTARRGRKGVHRLVRRAGRRGADGALRQRPAGVGARRRVSSWPAFIRFPLPHFSGPAHALPPNAHLQAAMSAFPPIPSASPPGADLPGSAAKGPHVTQSRLLANKIPWNEAEQSKAFHQFLNLGQHQHC